MMFAFVTKTCSRKLAKVNLGRNLLCGRVYYIPKLAVSLLVSSSHSHSMLFYFSHKDSDFRLWVSAAFAKITATISRCIVRFGWLMKRG